MFAEDACKRGATRTRTLSMDQRHHLFVGFASMYLNCA